MLSTLAKNFWEKYKDKGNRNVSDSSLSSFFLQVKNTKIRTTNKDRNKQVTVYESHRDVNVEDFPVGDKKKLKSQS